MCCARRKVIESTYLTLINKIIFFGYAIIYIGSGVDCNSVYLNHTSVVLENNGFSLSEGFSLSFRSCSSGVLLKKGNNDSIISLQNGDSTQHSTIQLMWNYNNGSLSYSTSINPFFSIDNNLLCHLTAIANTSGLIIMLRTEKSSLGIQKIHIEKQYLEAAETSGNLTLGSLPFSGCVYGNTEIQLGNLANNCPLENLSPCSSFIGCPAGYTGRFCEEDINECLINECSSHSTCHDLINGYECICGAYHTGRFCNIAISSPCDPTPCDSGGICRISRGGDNFTCICPHEFTGRYCKIPFFPCMESPCLNDGVCFNSTARSYNCTCKPGFLGTNCERNYDDCALEPCNRGKCTDLVQNFTCNCTGSGFQGDYCEIDLDECQNSPCQNGNCTNLWGTYRCTCQQGYTGTNCESDIDDCQADPCENGGNCTDLVDSFNCTCADGFDGHNCSVNINDCNNNICVHSNSCVDLINDYQCICITGYTGKKCDVNIDDCSNFPCNNGTCVDGITSFSCNCSEGYTGDFCDVDINDCADNPCKNNATCNDAVNNYTCICKSGYTGQNCDVNINDCPSGHCLNGGFCVDGLNNFSCTCKPSFTGPRCETYQDPCTPHLCKNGATCVNDTDNTTRGYKCECTSDYGGPNCEFKLGLCFPNNPCVFGQCNETDGSYNCTCDTGYQGVNCSLNVNECEVVDCNNGQCIDTNGSFYCNCSSGYEGDRCQNDIDECKIEKPCLNNGVCQNRNGTFKCFCDGFYGDRCEFQVFECLQFKQRNGEDYCKNDGLCIELGSLKIRCDCSAGFDGERCQNNINECEFGYCKNGANCTDLINDYNCSCVPGFIGRNCSIDVNECDSDPCENNSTCIDLINQYQCNCSIGFNGTHCENDIDWCLSNPCQNGANCTDGVETYTCGCFPGFVGDDCSIDIKDCQPNPCVYVDQESTAVESICVERSNLTAMEAYNQTVNRTSYGNRDGYVCFCIDGVNGTNCSIDLPNCNLTSCENNATCVDLVNDFKCNCVAGYTGKRCDVEFNECDRNPCLHNNTCIDLFNNYTCNCSNLFTGRNCETPLDPCAVEQPCQNNATCQRDDLDFKCACQDGFYGELCEKISTVNFNGTGYWYLNASQSLGYISMRFITTITNNSLQVIFSDGSAFLMYLQAGTLYLQTNQAIQKIGSSIFSDGQWHSLKLTVDTTIFIQIDNLNFSTPFPNISINNIIYIGKGYKGCIQNVVVDNKTYIPLEDGLLVSSSTGSCYKKNVCHSNACNMRGQCIDLWDEKECRCSSPYFGDHCQNEISSFNFQANKAENSSRLRRANRSAFASSDVDFTITGLTSFSFRMRSRQSNAFIALLVSSNAIAANADFTYILYRLKNGSLDVSKGTMNGGITSTIHLTTQQNDGIWHHIVHSNTALSDNGVTKSFVTSNTTVKKVYLADVSLLNIFDTLSLPPSYDGCLQAIKYGNTLLTNQLVVGSTTSNISLSGVMDGCNGANVCSVGPCLHESQCNDLWNAFNCTCQSGFTGNKCSLFGCQYINACPSTADCLDLPDVPGQTKCVYPLTYNGLNSSSSIIVGNTTPSKVSFSIRTRQTDSLIFATYQSNVKYVVFAIDFTGKLVISGKNNNITYSLQGSAVNDGQWHKIDISGNTLSNNNINITTTTNIDQLLSLLSNTILYVGAHTEPFIQNLYLNSYEGCFKSLMIGSDVVDLDNATSVNTLTGCHSNNPCTDSPCVSGDCLDTFNDFECQCPTYYTKKKCDETVNVTCAFPTPLCKNNATCKNISQPTVKLFSDNGYDHFECNCLNGFEGYYCQNETNECIPDPCQNGAPCTDLVSDYKCACTAGWEGKNCSNNIDDCTPQPCINNGKCIDELDGFKCNCNETGYEGSKCSNDVNECSMNVCTINSNSCINTNGSFNCSCNQGYFGKTCQYNNTQLCEIQEPCLNGASCNSNMTGFYCQCASGFLGKTCSEDFKECDTYTPCKNGGNCSDSHATGILPIVSGYNCSCIPQFEGKNCTEEVNPCELNPCLNRGNCTKVTYNTVNCTCSVGFEGSLCENSSPSTSDDNNDLPIIIGGSIGALILIIIILVFLFVKFFRDKSGMEGTYSPNKEEQQVGNVEMNTLKKPNAERLI